MDALHVWLDKTLNRPDVRSRLEAMVTADGEQGLQLAQQLQTLRAQMKETAYQKIFEARAKVSEDLLALNHSLGDLIHYSSVVGEDASIFLALQRQVASVTQKISFFGEDDANGDGVRDSAVSQPGKAVQPTAPSHDGSDAVVKAPLSNDVPSLDLQPTDDLAPDSQPQPSDDQVLPPEQQQHDANEAPADADPENSKDAELTQVVDEMKKTLPAAKAPAEQASKPDDSSTNDRDAASEDEDAAPADTDNEHDDSAPTDRADEDADEDKDEDKNKPKKKVGFLDALDEEKKEDTSNAAASVAPVYAAEEEPAGTKRIYPRFAYFGLAATKNGQRMRLVIGDKLFAYEVKDGDPAQVDAAIRKALEVNKGYARTVRYIRDLVNEGALKKTAQSTLTLAQIQKIFRSPKDKAQLGSVALDAGTPWSYRGLGIRKDTNQAACLWFEIGGKEYGMKPNPDNMKPGEDIDSWEKRFKANLENLSYDAGLQFLVRMLKAKRLIAIYAGKIGE